MNVLLISPRQHFKQGNIWKSVMGCIPPLGIAQLAAYLLEKNIAVKIIDANAESLDEQGLAARVRVTISESGLPDFTGVTATTNTYVQAVEAAKTVKSIIGQSPLVVGGVHATILPEDFLKHDFVDYCVRGEGEIPFFELVSGMDKTCIKSLSYKSGGKMIHNALGPVLDDLNALPMPAYGLLPMGSYRPSLGGYKKLPAIGMVTSRGCPGKCTFCYGQYFGKKVRFRSAEKIVEEIVYLQKTYNIREISFYDDTFSAARANLKKFCELMINLKTGVTWSCFSRTDFVNAEILKLMKKAGCHQICYGVESGDEEILKNIRKEVSLDTAKEAIRLTKAAGIEARATFMLGNPGETVETLKKTYRFALHIDPDIALFNITTPFPGTAMFEWAASNSYIKTFNWADYDLSKTVMEIPGLKPAEIEYYYKKFNKEFYLRPSYLVKRLFKLTSFDKLRTSLTALRAVISK